MMRQFLPFSTLLSRRYARGVAGFGRSFLTSLLLLALALSAVVPQGMMRVADAGGMRLVLCTPEGPREIWMGADGQVQDRAPLPAQNQEPGKCLLVAAALGTGQQGHVSLAQPAQFERFRPDLTAPHATPVALRHTPETRAPPVSFFS